MKVIINNFIPFKGYIAMTVWPFIFARKELKRHIYNHECIHAEQQKEMAIVPFFILYSIEYLVKLILTFNHEVAYKSISFEHEAYRNECDLNYLKVRKRYNWIKYIFTLWK